MTIDLTAMFGSAPAASPQAWNAPAAAPAPQATNRLSIVGTLQGLHTAQPQKNATYFQEGNYLVAFKSLKCIQSNDGKGPLIIIEWAVDQSTNPNMPSGCEASHVIKVMGSRYAMSDMRNFIVAMAGLDESRDRDTIERDIMGPDASGVPRVYSILTQLEAGVPGLVGKQCILRCTTKTTKAGTPFTTHAYSALPKPTAA